jgi:hypothetical protein
MERSSTSATKKTVPMRLTGWHAEPLELLYLKRGMARVLQKEGQLFPGLRFY